MKLPNLYTNFKTEVSKLFLQTIAHSIEEILVEMICQFRKTNVPPNQKALQKHIPVRKGCEDEFTRGRPISLKTSNSGTPSKLFLQKAMAS